MKVVLPEMSGNRVASQIADEMAQHFPQIGGKVKLTVENRPKDGSFEQYSSDTSLFLQKTIQQEVTQIASEIRNRAAREDVLSLKVIKYVLPVIRRLTLI